MRTLASAFAAALALAAPAAAQENAVDIAGIPGVIAGDAEWQIAWSGPMTADGMSTTSEGDLLFAQEQSNAIWRLRSDGQAFVEYPYVHGAGAVSVDPQGRVMVVERSCTDPGLGLEKCDEPTRIVELGPEPRTIAEGFADGSSLGRLNDLHADGRGGAYFTQGALYHVTPAGEVTKLADVDNFTNGVVTSPDGDTLYVTDMRNVLAFDVAETGEVTNRRTFATLSRDTAGFGGDGLAVDAQGRLYVTGDAGIYVFDEDGRELGVIPVPRRAITLAFAGSARSQLYVGAMGATTPEGTEWTTPEGERNVAMTVYSVPMLATGAR